MGSCGNNVVTREKHMGWWNRGTYEDKPYSHWQPERAAAKDRGEADMYSPLTVVVWHRIGAYSEGIGMARRSAAVAGLLV
jgi:hypothetical protein